MDMYTEGTMDLNELIMHHPFKTPDTREQSFAQIIERATNRYFPVFEKVRIKYAIHLSHLLLEGEIVYAQLLRIIPTVVSLWLLTSINIDCDSSEIISLNQCFTSL